jgi:putative FmdB family regulatory protein
MPFYDYKCESCGEIYNIHHGFHQVDPITCSKCEIEMVKQIAATPAIFKGTGWAGTKRG